MHISAGAIIYANQGNEKKVVVLHRAKTNSWHLPKGTQHPGETLEQTALRETKEESGFEVALDEYIGKLDSVFTRDNQEIKKETHYFLAHIVNGDSESHDHEHDKVELVDYKTALQRLESFSLHEKEGNILKLLEGRFRNLEG